MFNLHPHMASFATCYYHPEILPIQDGIELQPDEAFETEAAKNADIGYRAWNKGILTWTTNETIEKIKALPAPSLKDEYTFIFKYWGKPWATYALVNRMIALHNPIKELSTYIKASKTAKFNPYKTPIERADYVTSGSALIELESFGCCYYSYAKSLSIFKRCFE